MPPESPAAVPDRGLPQNEIVIQNMIAAYVHASYCQLLNCRRISCINMKRCIQHTKECRYRANRTCPVCKKVIALGCLHVEECVRQENCRVTFCDKIKQKIAEIGLPRRAVFQLNVNASVDQLAEQLPLAIETMSLD